MPAERLGHGKKGWHSQYLLIVSEAHFSKLVTVGHKPSHRFRNAIDQAVASLEAEQLFSPTHI
jgi:hypothetical protein